MSKHPEDMVLDAMLDAIMLDISIEMHWWSCCQRQFGLNGHARCPPTATSSSSAKSSNISDRMICDVNITSDGNDNFNCEKSDFVEGETSFIHY